MKSMINMRKKRETFKLVNYILLVSMLFSQVMVPVGAWAGGKDSGGDLVWGDNILTFSEEQYLVKEGDGSVTVTLFRTGGFDSMATVVYETWDVSTEAGLDYAQTSDTITFDVGQERASFDINISDDDNVEEIEELLIQLRDATGVSLDVSETSVFIFDNDDMGQGEFLFSRANFDAKEDDESILVTVFRTGSTDASASVEYATLGGSATYGKDYNDTSGILDFGVGEMSRTFYVDIIDDGDLEDYEELSLILSKPSGAVLHEKLRDAYVTIYDNEIPAGLYFSQSSYTAEEENSTVRITVQREGNIDTEVSVDYYGVDDSATAEIDYSLVPGTLTFLPEETSKSFDITLMDDLAAEGDEIVNLALTVSGGPGVLWDPGTAELVITDNDTNPLVELDKADYRVNEGEGSVTLTVKRRGNTNVTTSVNYATADQGATGGEDYTPVSGTLMFDVGETSKTITVDMIDDKDGENEETFFLELSDPSPGTVLGEKRLTLITITDNETPGELYFSEDPLEVDEGNGSVIVVVHRSEGSDCGVTVDYTTLDDSAIAGKDYEVTQGTLEFAPGETSQNITVPLHEDNSVNGSRSFTLRLDNATGGATMGLRFQTITILDNEQPGQLDFSTTDFSANEGDSNVFITVNRSGGTSGEISVQYATAGGTATAGKDFEMNSGTIFFEDGETSKTFTVVINEDNLVEGEENFCLTLYDPTVGVNLGAVRDATVTIIDNETPGALGFEQESYQFNEDVGTVPIGVYRTGGSDGEVKVNYAHWSGTADQEPDTVGVSGTLVFSPGETYKTISYAIMDDDEIENQVVYTLKLINPIGGATLGSEQIVTINITNNDFPGSVQFDKSEYSNLESDGSVPIVVTRTGGSAGYVNVTFSVTGGTASLEHDYWLVTGTLTFAPGVTSLSIPVTIEDDNKEEERETITLELTNPSDGATLGEQVTAEFTIADNDVAGELKFIQNGYSVIENVEYAILGVIRTGGSDGEVSVNYTTSDDTAIAGQDYVEKSGTLRFGHGEMDKTLSVQLIDNDGEEDNEVFNLVLSNPTGGATLGEPDISAVKIIDNDNSGAITFIQDDYSVTEGQDFAVVTIYRNGGSDGEVTVDYSTVNGTARAGEDFQGVTGTQTFTSGQTTQTLSIPVHDDEDVEDSETFTVELNNPVGGADLGNPTTTVTINDNEVPGQIVFSPAEYSINESGGNVLITVCRTGGSDGTVTVDYTTKNGTAVAGEDYQEISGSLIFEESQTSQTINISVYDDQYIEDEESFTVELSNPTGGATLGEESTAMVSIADDEMPGNFEIGESSYSLSEDKGSVEITVNRVGGSDGVVTVDYTTANGTASSREDYTVTSGTLSFDEGQISQVIQIPVNNDSDVEGDENFTLALSNPTGGATLGEPSVANVTIMEDDSYGRFEFSQDEYSIAEDDGSVTITVHRVGGNIGNVSVGYSTADDTAVSEEDYQAISGNLDFAPEDTYKTFTVEIKDDNDVEGDETIKLQLQHPTGGAELGTSSAAQIKIADNDSYGYIEFSQDIYNFLEDVGTAEITVNRTGGSSGEVSVDYYTAFDGGASSDDYETVEGIITFNAGETSKSIKVPLSIDKYIEDDEEFGVVIINPTGGAVMGSQRYAKVKILNDDLLGQVEFVQAEYVADENTLTATITVKRTGGDGAGSLIQYSTANGTAAAGADYQETNRWLSFGAGEMITTFPIYLENDKLLEETETVNLMLSDPNNLGLLGEQSTAVLGIVDDENNGRLEFKQDSYSVREEDGSIDISVLRLGGYFSNVAVDYVVDGGTAIEEEDFIGQRGTLNFGQWDESKTITIKINDDLLGEGIETVNLVLSNPTNSSLLGERSTAVLNITEEPGEIGFANASYSVKEGEGSIDISLTRTGSSDGTARVDYVVGGGTATKGIDYSLSGRTLEFAPGEISKSLTVEIDDDAIVEGDETLNLQLSNLSGWGQLGSQTTALLTLIDNETPGYFEFSDAIYNSYEEEGTAVIIVYRRGSTDGVVSVNYSTLDGTAGAGSDYTSLQGTLEFGPGEESKSFIVAILDDKEYEGSETVNLKLSDPTNYATLGDQDSALLKITDRQGIIELNQSAYQVNEDAGTVDVNIKRTGGTDGVATVDFVVSDSQNGGGTAQFLYDYFGARSGTLSFAPGDAEIDLTFDIIDNNEVESDETFKIQLRNPGGSVKLGSQTSGVITIVDNETRGVFEFSNEDYFVDENQDTALVTVLRSGGTLGQVTVDYQVTIGNAGTDDFTVTEGTLTFTQGENSKTFEVAISDDKLVEGSETVNLTLSNPTGRTQLGSKISAVLTINDDEKPGQVVFAKPTYTVDEGSKNLIVTLNRSGGSDGKVSVQYDTVDGSALAGRDYKSTSGIVEFAEGEASHIITLEIFDDAEVELEETFGIELSNPTGRASIGTPDVATISVRDNEKPGQFQFGQASYAVNENAGSVTFAVYRTGGGDGTVEVDYTTEIGTAEVDTDYILTNGTLVFLPGETQKLFTLQIMNDGVIESDETFKLRLSSPEGGGELGTLDAMTITIADDDIPGTIAFDRAMYSVGEGDGELTVTIKREDGTGGPVNVELVRKDGSATFPGDFWSIGVNTITFAPGQATASFTVEIKEDNQTEGNESFKLQLRNPSAGAGLGEFDSTEVTIFENEKAGSFEFEKTDYSGSEDDFVWVTINRVDGSDGDFYVDFVTEDGTAAGGNDYQSENTKLFFGGGVTTKTVPVRLLDDNDAEFDETVKLILRNPDYPATLGIQSTAVLTIQEKDAPGKITFATDQMSFTEGSSGVITVNRKDGSEGTVTVDYKTVDGTAIGGKDYEVVTGTLTFEHGVSSKKINVQLIDNTLVEEDKSFTLVLSNPMGGTVELGSVPITTLKIEEDEVPGQLEFNQDNYSIDEGHGNFTGTVKRIGGTDGYVKVDLVLTGGTSDEEDFVMADTTVNFAPGELSKTFEIQIVNDNQLEEYETINLSLSNPTGGATLGAQKETVVTLMDDEVPGRFDFSLGEYRVDEGNATADITVYRSGGSDGIVSVSYTVHGNTAIAEEDFVPVNGTLIFGAGETEQTFSVEVREDEILEEHETLRLLLSNPTFRATLGETKESQLTIIDNEQPGQFAFSETDFSVNEGDGYAFISVRRENGSDGEVKVDYTVSQGTAVEGDDYEKTSGTLAFEPGVTEKTFNISISEDSVLEEHETVTLELMNPTKRATLGDNSSALLTIFDNEQPGQFSFSETDFSVNERDSYAIITVKRVNGSDGEVKVDYTVSQGTAVEGDDYEKTSGTLVFGTGVTEETFNVPIKEDSALEEHETVNLELMKPTKRATLGNNSSVLLTIVDNEEPGRFGFGSFGYWVNEEAESIDITVTRSGGSDGTVQVDYVTIEGTAVAEEDYQSNTGTLVFGPGEKEKIITLTIINDTKLEGEESFQLELKNPTMHSTLDDLEQTTISIYEENARLEFNQDTYSVTENKGSVAITVNRIGSNDGEVTLHLTTASETALSGEDFTDISNTLILSPGENSKTYEVDILNDGFWEGNETFVLQLGEVTGKADLGAVVSAQVAITDDERDFLFSFDKMEYTADEGNGTSEITVTRTGDLSGAGTVAYAVYGETATVGEDFQVTSGLLEFVAGEETKTFNVEIIDDSILEEHETIFLQLTNQTGGRVLGEVSTAVLTITDNEIPGIFTFSVDTYSAMEDVGSAEITVSRSGGSDGEVSVDYLVEPGTAVIGEDYEKTSGTLIFAHGETSKVFSIPILNDTLVEEKEETVNLTLTNPSNRAQLGEGKNAVLKIVDSEKAGSFVLSGRSYSVKENESKIILTVNRTGGSDGEAFVEYQTQDGTAVAGDDYIANTGVLAFAPGEISKTFTVDILDDNLVEGKIPEELFWVSLNNPTVGTSLGSIHKAEISIINDDTLFKSPEKYFSSVDDMALGDFTGDGRKDLIGVDSGMQKLTLLEGQTDGTFQEIGKYRLLRTENNQYFGAKGIVAGDFNGDGKLDVAVSSAEDDIFAIIFGNGDGTFADAEPYNSLYWDYIISLNTYFMVGDRPFRIISNDVNNDGLQDLLTLNGGSDTVSILINSGGGTFKKTENYAINMEVICFNTGDLNGDGKIDLFVGGEAEDNIIVEHPQKYSDVERNLAVLLGNGDGTFQTPRRYSAGGVAKEVASGDFDGDGIADIAVANQRDWYNVHFRDEYIVRQTNYNVSVILGSEDGTFQQPKVAYEITNSLYAPRRITAGDINGDYIDDLVFAIPGKVFITRGKGDGTFEFIESHSAGSQRTKKIMISDLGGNYTSDIAVVDWGRVYVLHNNFAFGQLWFSEAKYSVDENVGSMEITVNRLGGSDGTATVDYSTADGWAKDGVDYHDVRGTLTFKDGETSKTFSIPILDDEHEDVEETIILTMSNPTGGAHLGRSKAILSISDDEEEGILFQAPVRQFENYETLFDASEVEVPGNIAATYQWDFGDGTSGTGETATHNYRISGEYTVYLDLIDKNGIQLKRIKKDITIVDYLPEEEWEFTVDGEEVSPKVREEEVSWTVSLMNNGIPMEGQEIRVNDNLKQENTDSERILITNAQGNAVYLSQIPYAYGTYCVTFTFESHSITRTILVHSSNIKLSGQVFDERTGKPLKGVKVTLSRDKWRKTIETDSDGFYLMEGLRNGKDYKLKVGDLSQDTMWKELEIESLPLIFDSVVENISMPRRSSEPEIGWVNIRSYPGGADYEESLQIKYHLAHGKFTHPYQFNKDSNNNLRIEVRVDWKSMPSGSVHLQRIDKNGILKNDFTLYKVDSDNGDWYEIVWPLWGLPFQDDDMLRLKLEDLAYGWEIEPLDILENIELPGDLSPSIPVMSTPNASNLPFLKDAKIALDFNNLEVKGVHNPENSTIQVYYGYMTETKGEKWTYDTRHGGFKRGGRLKVGITSIPLIGGGKYLLTWDGEKWQASKGQFNLFPREVNVGHRFWYVIPPPVNFRAGMGGKAEGDLDLKFQDFEPERTYPMATLSGEVDAEVFGEMSVGVGIRWVLSGDVWGRLGGQVNFDYDEPSVQHNVFLSGGHRVSTLFGSKSWEWDRITWASEKTVASQSMNSMMQVSLGNLEPSSRNYLKERSEWMPQQPETMAALAMAEVMPLGINGLESLAKAQDDSHVSETIIQTNAFPFGEPRIINLDKDKMMLVWVNDTSEKEILNNSWSEWNNETVSYSVFDGETWTDPRSVSPDGTSDAYPNVTRINNGAVAAWVNTSKVLDENDSPLEKLKSSEIAVSVYDNEADTWSTAKSVTEDVYFDRAPVVAGHEDSAMVVWLKNTSNYLETDTLDKVFLPEGDQVNIMYSKWEDDSWSTAQAVYSGAGSIVNGTLAYNGDSAVYAYIIDEDRDFETTNDQELYGVTYDNSDKKWEAPIRLTFDGLQDANPQVHYLDGTPMVFWYQEGNIVYVKGLDQESPNIAVWGTGGAGLENFNLATGKNGNLSLVWGEDTEGNQEIFVSVYDPGYDRWSQKVQLTSTGGINRSIDAVLDEDGNIMAAYNKVSIRDGGDSLSLGDVDLAFSRLNIGYDLGLTGEDITFSETNPAPGSTGSISATIHNKGELTQEGIPVAFYDGNPDNGGQQIGSTKIVHDPVGAGDMAQVSVQWNIPSTLTSHDIYVVIDPENKMVDRGRINNSAFTSVIKPDLEVVEVSTQDMGPDKYLVNVRVANSGYLVAPDVSISLTKGDREIDSVNIGDLRALGEWEESFIWEGTESDFENGVAELKATVSSTGEDASLENNIEYVVIRKTVKQQSVVIPVTGISLTEDSLQLAPGSSGYLVEIIEPANATKEKVNWVTSNPAVATVNDNGQVMAVEYGTATITATTEDGGFSTNATVAVSAPPVITLKGLETMNILVGEQYIEPGYTVLDKGVNISRRVQIYGNDIDTTVSGKYTVSYNCTNDLGVAAETKIRTVIVAPRNVSASGGQYSVKVSGATPFADLKLYWINNLVATGMASASGTFTFNSVTAGGGYYVTQSVNNMESTASDKITVSAGTPPEIEVPEAVKATGVVRLVSISGATSGAMLRLYNNEGVVIAQGTADGSGYHTFTGVPEGAGYYVTQVVKGVESPTSHTVNVTEKRRKSSGRKNQADPEIENEADLRDISGHWAEENIKKLVTLGAISGYPDGTFMPGKTISRAELATVLVKAFKVSKASGNIFNDTQGHWAKDFIDIAATCGIVSGYGENNFAPNEEITREQMAAMIVRAAQLEGTGVEIEYKDSELISNWAKEAVAIACENKLITGYPDNTFRPQGKATRAEAVAVIIKALK